MPKTVANRVRKQLPHKKVEKPEKLGLKKFIKKAPKYEKTKKEKNTYHFVGFFERLKQIDVKVAHASLVDQAFMFDQLQGNQSAAAIMNEEDLSTCNFIALIKQEKVNNATLEFKRVWKDLEHLAYSFPLVIMNKAKLVKKLMQQLQTETLKNVYPAIIDLVIALVKDLRQDIYPAFMHEILPVVIGILDSSNLALLDAVFSLLSFSFKYLLNPIRDDLKNFYSVFVELLLHKNRFVRKFAAQSFSYVLRKVKFTSELVQMLCAVQQDNEVLGLVDLLFEVCSGETDSLHSKAAEVLTMLLDNLEFIATAQGLMTVRYLYLKLVNTVDTAKQLPMFEILTAKLQTRALPIMNDTIKLKMARRVSTELGRHFLQTLGQLMKADLSEQDQCIVAESLSQLFYFQYSQWKESKIFTQQVYTMCEKAVGCFFKILMMRPSEITTDSDIPVAKILDIKQAKVSEVFNAEGHRDKCWHMVPSLNKWTLKHLNYERIALLLSVIDKSGQQPLIEIGGKCVQSLTELLKQTSSEIDTYLMCKFISMCNDNKQWLGLIKFSTQNAAQNTAQVLDQNLVLAGYPSFNWSKMIQSGNQLFDLYNQGQKCHLQLISKSYIHSVELTPETAQSLSLLKKVLANKAYLPNTQPILSALCSNLAKNSRQLRILTLRVLQMLPPLNFLAPADDSKLDRVTVDKHYTGKCPLINLLLKAEEAEISLETEKIKSNLLRKAQTLLHTELVPQFYVDVCYKYAVGCFWVKFTPVYQSAMDMLEEVFRQKEMVMRHLELWEQVAYLIQIGEDNQQVIAYLSKAVALNVVTPATVAERLFIDDTTAECDFAQLKDFYVNLTKSMFSCLDLIMGDVQLRGILMHGYTQFMEYEFAPLHFGRRKEKLADFHQTVIASNQTDSQEFKAARRISYNKLCVIYELLSKTNHLNKLSPQQSQTLIDHYLELLQTADDKLQQSIMQGLLKSSKKQDFDNKTIKLPKYQKLLEGLCDDIKFKDMILVIAHGQEVDQGEDAQDEDDENGAKQQKQKESIPKLADEDRLQLLPIIVKLLFSKLLKQRGKINQKSLQQRRTIVYQFLSGLDPITEFPIFFKELLEPLGLSITTTSLEQIRDQLQLVSFSQFVQYIGSVEVIFAQLGTQLCKDTFLVTLTNILVLMLAQAKKFMGHMKDDTNTSLETPAGDVYQFVNKQCKMCVRKGLKIVKHLYSRFSHIENYAAHLSKLCYDELVKDQVAHFKDRYISERAQLIEIVTTHWSSHSQQEYLRYPEVIPALMEMLKQGAKVDIEVYALHLGMIKNLVVSSIDSDQERLRLINAFKPQEASDHDESMSSSSSGGDSGSESAEEQEIPQLGYSEVARKVLSDNITVLCEGLHVFWQTHSSRLRQALLGSSNRLQKSQNQSKNQIYERIVMTNAVRDLTFIMSELSTYIASQVKSTELTHSFLDMMVGLVSQKNMLHAVSTFQFKSRLEELLIFGLTAITNLLSSDTDMKIQERISEMFIHIQSKKARQRLASGLHRCYQTKTTQILLDMNTVKKGQADIEYDYDRVLNGIQQIRTVDADRNVLVYCLLSLMQHQEYSLREYALHALTQQLGEIGQQLFRTVETQVLSMLKVIRDEMIMKTTLLALRALVTADKPFAYQTQGLRSLINAEHEDFFSMILSMQLPQRLKALRKLQAADVPPSLFNRALLPLVDYLIFDMKSQQENRRNTVRYSRDQSNLLQEEALTVYTQYASKLSWGQYMSLVRKMLYKIEKAQSASNSVAAQKQDSLNEKVICKCLCKVLDGFNFAEVPDAVELLKKTVEEQVAHKYEVVEYSDFLRDMVGQTLDESEESDGGDKQSDIEEDDVQMPQVTDKVEDIQSKLQKKILPLLQRHILQTKGENTTIRSFVAVAIAKVIRKLPVPAFKLHLQKLVNLIVVKGLRVKDLNTREKARKALIKVIQEVSPRFLTLIIQEMGNNLDRGFQLHVYLYTVHYVFNHMREQMKSGQITTQMIKLVSPLLLREMFGDLMEERQATEETAKKHIKESKARKAMPIYEVFAEFIDFKHSFLDLIQPIVKVLEDNPNHSAIQQTEDLLARVANSVLKNTSISGQKLLPFMRQIIEKGVLMSMRLKINDEKAKRDYGAKADQNHVQKSKAQLFHETHQVQILWSKTSQQASDRKTQEICGRVLANFGLQTLKKALNQKGLVLEGDEYEERQSKLISIKEELVLLLDPFVQPLLDSFKTFYNPIVIQTLQIMNHVIHLGLPSFKLLLRKFLNRIFKLFTQNTSADNDFTNSLFKCTAELIRTYSIYNDLSEVQIKTLVQIIKSNLQNFSTQTSVFTCLRAILFRRFQCADLYDLMTSVQDMMVTSVQRSTRQTCTGIFLTFVLEYPMEEKRLDTHIQHLLKNLTYFDPEGRQQLLETLQILVDKMPEAKFQSWTDLIFLTLFLRMVNEPHHRCRELVTSILKKLILKSNKRYTDTVFQMNAQDSEALLNGKIQILTVIADCGKLQKQDIQRTVDLLADIIAQAAQKAQTKQEVTQEDSDEVNPEQAEFLKGIGLESSDDEAMESEPEEDQWSNVYFSMNCLENIFAKCGQSKELVQSLQKHKELKPNILTLTWRSNNYWVRLSCQRIVGFILQEAGVGALNVDSSLKLAYQLLSVLNFSFVTEQLCAILMENVLTVLKTVDLADLQKVFKKASYIGRRILGDKSDQTQIKLQALVQFYDKAMPYLAAQSQLATCVGPMLELIYRTYTDEQQAATVRDASTELVDKMSEAVDKDEFIKIFNQVQMAITQARTDRKIKEKMLVTNEEGIVKLARKRAKKLGKRKEKHRQKVLMNQLTR